MIGLIDVGGGLRDVYGAGVLDYCLDNGLDFSYFIGVSAGSANIATFLARQKGRTLRFYRDYSMRTEYMSFRNFIKNGSYIDLDYVYGDLSLPGGEDPLDFDEVKKHKQPFFVVVTNAENGKAEYYDFYEEYHHRYAALKASCCIPMVCKPCKINGGDYFDGGLADPVPIRKAFEDGCDKVIVMLTRPAEYRKRHRVKPEIFNRIMKKYPEVGKLLDTSIDKYNDDVEYITKLEKEGRVLIIAPDDCCGVETLSRNKESISALYRKGYGDGEKIKSFMKKEKINDAI